MTAKAKKFAHLSEADGHHPMAPDNTGAAAVNGPKVASDTLRGKHPGGRPRIENLEPSTLSIYVTKTERANIMRVARERGMSASTMVRLLMKADGLL